jgi:hypothetical protein
VAFAESRIRGETIAAEDVLHDLGAISIISSDSQAMGRVGEVITRTWQTADKMAKQRGRLAADVGNNDNVRIRRYIASTPSTRRSPTEWRTGRLGGDRQARRSGAVAAGLLRDEARSW